MEDPHLSLILRVERIALVARYLGYALALALVLGGYVQWSLPDLIVATVVIAAHNVFAHWVFATRRHHLFCAPLNFGFYLVEASILVGITGADTSDLFVFYFFLLAGYSAYTGRFSRTLLVTALCCASFGVVVALKWGFAGIQVSPGIFAVKLFLIGAFGWLAGRLGDFLARAQGQSLAHAQALAGSESALRTILNSTADPILVCDDQEFITDANARACTFLGVSREQLLGERLRRFLFDDGTLPSKLAALWAQGEYQGEFIALNADGEERTVDSRTCAYVRDGSRFFVAVFHDVTEQKNLQEATRLANVNLARLNRELCQVNQMKTQFLATMSQKLRSPLTAILGFVELLLREELGEIAPEQRDALQSCRSSLRRTFALMDEALEFGRAEPPPAEPAPTGQPALAEERVNPPTGA